MATYKKSDLIKELTEKTGIKRKETIALLDAVFEIACREAKEEGFNFPGLFKIDMTTRKQRRMRNPQTGQPILITEHMAPRIRILKKAKDTITADEPKKVIPLGEPVASLATLAPDYTPATSAPGSLMPPAPAPDTATSVAPTFTSPAAFTPPPVDPEPKPEAPEVPAAPSSSPAFTSSSSTLPPIVPDFKSDITTSESTDLEATESVAAQAEEPLVTEEKVETDPPAEEKPSGIVYDDFTDAVSFKCQACDGEIEAPIAAAGYTSECPVCGQPVVIPTESEPGTIHGAKLDSVSLDTQVEAAAERAFSEASLANQKNQTIRIDLSTLDTNAPEAPKAQERIVSFFCKTCKQELEAPTKMMGMKSECPDCGAGFEVPFFSDPGTLRGSDLEKTDIGKTGNLHNRTIRIEMPDF